MKLFGEYSLTENIMLSIGVALVIAVPTFIYVYLTKGIKKTFVRRTLDCVVGISIPFLTLALLMYFMDVLSTYLSLHHFSTFLLRHDGINGFTYGIKACLLLSLLALIIHRRLLGVFILLTTIIISCIFWIASMEGAG